MDRREAINVLNNIIPIESDKEFVQALNEAIDLAIEALQPVENMGEVSDGYHTFNQLYHQRAVLFATIVNQNKDKAWKSWKHEDGKFCFDKGGEWFIVGVDTPEGSYTYHYEKKYWDMFDCEELDRGKHWDGHTEEDVTRLLSLPPVNQKQITGKLENAENATSESEESTTGQPKSKLKNPCDSLLKADSDECKEQKSKLDCISRQDAVEAIEGMDWYHVNSKGELVHGSTSEEESWYRAEDVYKAIEALPPVTPTGQTTKEIMDFIGGMNMVGEISNEAYAKTSDFVDDGTPTEKQEHGRLIDADALIEDIEEMVDHVATTCDMDMHAVILYADVVKERIDNAPTVITPTERTGEWMVEERDSIYGKKIRLTCSECGDVFDVTESAYPYERYCRYCGAKMKGGTENE